MVSKSLVVIALLAVTLLASGCCCCVPCAGPGPWVDPGDWDWSGWTARTPIVVGDLRQEQQSVPVDPAATSAQVTVSFGGGEFDLRPGAEGLLDGEFVYNVDDLAPNLETRTQGGVQMVTLRHRQEIRWGDWDTRNVRNEWDVRLNRDVPMDLTLNLGAFVGQADLSGLRLRELALNAGACTGEVSFSAPNPETMRSLDVVAGAAKLSLTDLGNARFQEMTFRGGAGDFVLDFDGFQGQARVLVESGVSKVVIRIPRGVGARVELDGVLSTTHLMGFSQNGNVFTNASYGEAGDQLTLSVTMGMGDLTLESK